MAEELTQSLQALADRGTRRGARLVLESARNSAAPRQARPWVQRPVWVAAAAFAGTLFVLGGSLIFGLAIRRPGTDVGSAGIREIWTEVTATSSQPWALIVAIATVVAAAALVVRHQLVRARKEKAMTSTIDKKQAEHAELIGTARRNNRWLVMTVIVLAVGLVALGAWAIYDQTVEPETAAPAEVTALYEDYVEAWRNSDRDAFLALTTEDFTFNSSGRSLGQAAQALTVSMAGDFDPALIGDLVVMGDGPEYYVAAAEKISLSGSEYVGVSAFRFIETPDGLRVAEHTWIGNL